MRRLLFMVCLSACSETPGNAIDPVGDTAVDAARPDVSADATLPDSQAADAAPPGEPRVGLNEVDCRARWVELFNRGAGPADLSDYVILDPRPRFDRQFRLQGALPAGGFVQVTTPFPLYCEDMNLRLRGPNGESEPVAAPVGRAAGTYGRLPDGTGDWTETAPTPAAPNQAIPARGEGLFSDAVHRLEFDLPELAFIAIGNDAEVEADATMVYDDDPSQVIEVQTVGRNGRFQRIDQKPTLDIKLSAPIDGITAFQLDAAPLDPAFLTRALAGEMMRVAGLPTPRTGFAWVVVNGEDYGLYLISEAMDQTFLDRHFASTWHLYAGTNEEFRLRDTARFDALIGATYERGDLLRLVDFFEVPEGESYYANTADFIDWPQVTREMAAETYIGNLDGYAVNRTEARAHFDNRGRLSLLPAGLDLALREPRAFHNGRGELLRRCVSDAACRPLYDAQLIEVIEALHGSDWDARLTVLRDTLRPWVEMDPRRISSLGMFDADILTIETFLTKRRAEATPLAPCLATETDRDGDGYRCDEDCGPDDPQTYLGAIEICGDDIDQNCSGTLDDGTCPDCVPRVRGNKTFYVCLRQRWWEAAGGLCRQVGAELATFDSRGEARWLFTEARLLRRQEYWIGLSDREEEGVYAWVDGVERDVDWPWNTGEPNDGGGDEDCVHFRTDGRWNDVDCDTARGILCSTPCEHEDLDGDGFSACGYDCDDNNPDVHPDAVDTCGDGIDQDCNGAIDDDDCGCVTAFRGPHEYAFCSRGVPYATARETCQERGMEPIIVNSADENQWAFQTASRVAYGRWWLGLTDLETEGTYRYWDGSRPDYVDYNRGEPNDYNRVEDCVHYLESRAQWNDIGCDSNYGALCETVCAPGEDADGDGALRCGDDCDDGDASIMPGAEELCDGIDQDCDGVVDEGCAP